MAEDGISPKPTREDFPGAKHGKDLQYLRGNNLWVLFSHVRDDGPTSRLELAKLTGLAPSSITRLIRTLSELGLVMETGKGRSSGGRQPTLIVPNPDAGLVISFDLSGPQLRGGLFDATNRRIKVIEEPFYALGPEAIQDQMLEVVQNLLTEPAARDHRLLGIGVSQPGTFNPDTYDIVDAYNLRLHNFPLKTILTAKFNLPVFVEHDASVAALSEFYYGAGRGLENMVYVLVSTGIGSGIILDGKIYRGVTGKSGEFGHIVVDPGGALCVCGRRGCLEAVAAAPAMLASARWMLEFGKASRLSEICDGDPKKVTIGNIAKAAELGDLTCQDIMAKSADYLAQGISTYGSLLGISKMIVGGEVAETGACYFDPLNRSLARFCAGGLEIEVIPAQLRNDSYLRGISMLTLQEVLRFTLQQ